MSLDQQRTYLERVLPWPPHGDPNAYFNVHFPTKKLKQQGHDAGKPFWGGRACKTLDEMLQQINHAQSYSGNKGDIYICMSSQRIAEQRTVNNYSFTQAVKTTAGAVQLKSLFIDVDVKPDKPEKAYGSTNEAVAALSAFVKSVGLPKPSMVVFSGTGGMHVYWVFDVPVTPAEWKPLAEALANATRQYGLKCDTQCTVDAARILRVPGTFNWKQHPPLPVRLHEKMGPDYTYDEMKAALAGSMLTPFGNAPARQRDVLATALAIHGAAPAAALAMGAANEELAGGVERESKPIILQTVTDDCPMFKHVFDTHGVDQDQALWNLQILATTFAENGLNAAHDLSYAHPDYDAVATEQMFERKGKEREERQIGWPMCRAFQNAGSSQCQTCPHRDKGKSPLHFAKRATMPAGAQTDLPQGYLRDSAGIVYKIEADGENSVEQIPVYDRALADAWVQENPWTLHFVTERGNGSRLNISVKADVLQKMNDMSAELAHQGMDLHEFQKKRVKDFLVSWIKHLKTLQGAVVSAHPFGWIMDGNKIGGFSYGGKLYTPTGERPTATADHELGVQYSPHGELDKWKEAAKVITDQGRPALETILAMSFGAPLMKFAGQPGVVMSAYSKESGIGKTTALKIAQAVWANPALAVQTMTDTGNSVFKKAGELRALPMFWDEISRGGGQDISRFSDMAFQITGGVERARLAADTSQRARGTWQTMLLAASNDSLLDFVTRGTKSTTAGIMRVFEFAVPPPVTSTGNDVGRVSRLVENLSVNYGTAGELYARYLGENFVEVMKNVEKYQDHLLKTLNAQNHERFWIAAIACCVVGASTAKNKLGLVEFHMKDLQQFLLETFQKLRNYEDDQPNDLNKSSSLEAVLSRYLVEMQTRHTVVTNKIHQGRGKPAAGSITVMNDTSKLVSVYVQIGEDDELLRINMQQFRQWLHDSQYNTHVVCEEMKTKWGMKRIQARLAGGTMYAATACDYHYEVHRRTAGLITD